MGDWVTATDDDTLCSLAVAGGFLNCKPLRDHPSNAKIKDRQLQLNDSVYVPSVTERVEDAATETTHIFVRPGVPLAKIRFVHGGHDNAMAAEPDLDRLNISNYPTDRAGTDGTDTFAGPDHWRFDASSDQDPDTFKVEIRETRTGKTKVDVTLEALHPVYLDDGTGPIAIGVDEKWSSDAERTRRQLTPVHLQRASADPAQRFRSAYLRLVVDEQDKAARPRQTLLVTDDQPHEERVEILDQYVRATYLLDGCPVAGDAQCRVAVEKPVGGDNKRIRLCVGIFRRRVGDATGVHGITEANLHHRLFHWFRRTYAQANMAPKLVEPGIRLLDPPPRNLVTVSNLFGNPATGSTAAGRSPSRMSLTVATDRSAVGVANATKNVTLDIPRAATVATRLSPLEVANLLAAQIEDDDFSAKAFENAPALNRPRNRRSADVLVTDKAGGRVSISAVRSNDSGASLQLATLNINNLIDFGNNDMQCGTMDERQVIRNFHEGDDRLNCYVVGSLASGARGESFTPGYDMDPDYQSPAPIPFSCIMGAVADTQVMDGSNSLPYTFPHEAGHALLDSNHARPRSQLLASGTSKSPGVHATKRLCDKPVRLSYELFVRSATEPAQTVHRLIFAASRLRDLADGASSAMFESW